MQPTSQLSQARPNRIKWSHGLTISYQSASRELFERANRATSRLFRCGQRFCIRWPGSDYASRAVGETAPALQPDEDASAPMLAPSDESALECAQPEEPPGQMACRRRSRRSCDIWPNMSTQVTIKPQRCPLTTQPKSSQDPSAETQKDMDRVPFPAEPEAEG